MSKGRRVQIGVAVVATAILAFFTFVLATFHRQLRGTAIDSPEVFESLIGRSVPAEVKELQAVASSGMQGYQAFIRFQTPSLAAIGLDRAPYEPAECDRILLYFGLPERIRSPFVPEWEVPVSADRQCLSATSVRNVWASEATNHAVYAGGWVYFVSWGD